MSQYKVVCLVGEGGQIVSGTRIEELINKWVQAGWRLVTVSTGGGGDSNYYQMWVYLVFER